MPKFYLTTPIYYVNDRPHIGHAYTTFAADAIAAWCRMRGDETFFLTGTDENAQKNAEAAAQRLGKPMSSVTRAEIQAYVDEMSALWSQTWDSLGIRYDRFIRTTEATHVRGVEQFIAAVRARNPEDIYRGTYTGWYCVGCEAFVPETDAKGGMCPTHVRALEKLEEENYFFRLSRYHTALLQHIERNPTFVQPEARRNEIVAYISEHLTDISISRPIRNWGIPFPGDPSQTVYVWFDALVNYLTGVGYNLPVSLRGASARATRQSRDPVPAGSLADAWDDNDGERFDHYWPAQLHLVGKDIIKFHCALWPAMLMAAGLPLPERVFAHGFFTIEGKKMSKSLGNVINPTVLADRYGTDALRYFLLREIPFGGDGDFSEERLRQRYASDLQHGVGNFAARTITMVRKYNDGVIPPPRADVGTELENSFSPSHRDGSPSARAVLPLPEGEREGVGAGTRGGGRGEREGVGATWRRYTTAMDALLPHEALDAIEELIRTADRSIESEKPWVLAKDPSKRERLLVVLGNLCETLRHIALMEAPFMPDTATKILTALGQPDWHSTRLTDLQKWGRMKEGTVAGKLEHLFPRLS